MSNPSLSQPGRHAPVELTVNRAEAVLTISWVDGHFSRFPLTWLRANCPCASCREERRSSAGAKNELSLRSGPLPSAEIRSAELVGGYALRPTWADGHDTGIYTFASLRTSCPCSLCHPQGPPLLLLN